MPIVQKNEPILRGKAKQVPIKDITSDKIKGIISTMKRLLEKEQDGVAIAAPQIGEPLAIFIVSHRVFDILEDASEIEQENVELKKSGKTSKARDLVFINPVISKLSRKKEWMEEGCLSVRWLYGKVSRATKAKITAYNEQGIKFELGASGLLAQVFQHEYDHLHGVLFIDKAKDLHELPSEEIERIKSKENE